MSTQMLLRVFVGTCVLLVIAIVSERSRTAAGILGTMPVNIPLALWVAQGNSQTSQELAPLARALLVGLIPTMVFTAICWVGLGRGWSLPVACAVGYVGWAAVLAGFRALALL